VFLPGCLAPALATLPLSAQTDEGLRFGVGYVANAPDLLAGGSAYVVLRGVGLYVDAKIDVDSPTRDDTFLESLTAREVEDQVEGARFRDTRDSWRGFNVAVVRPVNPSLMLYAGIGYAERNVYREYRDPQGELGVLGILTVEDPEGQETKVNGLVGAFLRVSRLVSVQTGFESTPAGFTVGASLRLPPR
jgi:hypothetical protein